MIETYNNYWKIYKNEIPSLGLLYNKKASIRIRPLNVQEVKYLTTLAEINATDVINEILEKCLILENINFEDILLADREYLVFWLRANSFTQSNGYSINIKCDKCYEQYEQDIKLSDFNTIFIDESKNYEQNVYLPDCNITLKIKPPTIKELNRKFNDYDIQTFMRYIVIDNFDTEIIINFLRNLSALDYTILKNNIDDLYFGLDKNITITCEKCGKNHQYNIEMFDYGLFSSLNMFDILMVILKISKYTQYQIPETMPWWEVEISQQVTNQMVEEEKAAMNKNDGKNTIYK